MLHPKKFKCLITISTFTSHSLRENWFESESLKVHRWSSKWICLIIATKCYVMMCNAAHHKCNITAKVTNLVEEKCPSQVPDVTGASSWLKLMAPGANMFSPVVTRTWHIGQCPHQAHIWPFPHHTELFCPPTAVQMKRRTNQVIRNSTKTDSNCLSSSPNCNGEVINNEITRNNSVLHHILDMGQRTIKISQ